MRRWVEIMFGQWLLPYNEIVAQWVDPFYDAGADSHTSIMGNVGFGSEFYNGGTFPFDKADFAYNGVFSLSFNRRQEEVIQYVWPNTGAMADQTPRRPTIPFLPLLLAGMMIEILVQA